MIGNYSLADQLAGVGLTPLGEDVLNDPRAMQRMGNDLAGMSAYQPQGGVLLDAEPAGAVYGQQGSSFFSATPEDDTNIVVKTIGTVLGAPFNLLRGAKEGLEEVIGHPYAQQRQAMDEQYAMLASVLSDSDKTLVGMPVDRTGINGRQAYGDTVATGVSSGIAPVLAPRKTGITELLTGENRKQRALQMARLQAALKAQGIKLNVEQAQADIYSKMGTGTSAFANARKTGVETDQLEEFGPQEWRGKIAKLGAETYQANAGGNANAALANQRNQMTPGMVAEQNAKALDAALGVNRNEELFRKATLPGALDTNERNNRLFNDVTYPQGIATGRRADEGFSIWKDVERDRNRRENELAEAEKYKRTAQGDAAIGGIVDDQARATVALGLLPQRQDLMRSETALNEQRGVTEIRRQEKLDTQTRAITDMAAAGIDKIYAQIGSFADASRLATARARLDEIRGDVLMNRDQRDAVFAEVRNALTETRIDLARQAQTNNDLVTKFRIKAIDADIARLESIVSLNAAREGAVGADGSSTTGGLAGLAKTITSGQMTGQRVMSGKEHDVIRKALEMMDENPEGAAALLRANGFDPNTDFSLSDRTIFGVIPTGKKRLEIPTGSLIEGSLGRVREQGSGKSFSTRTTGVGNEAATRPQAAPGQTRSTDGEVEEVFKDYGRNPKAIDAAYRAGLISESAARKAIEATGYQRAR